jgi:hypothetical protein
LPSLGPEPTFAASYYAGIPVAPMPMEEVRTRVASGRLRLAVVTRGAWPDLAALGLKAEPVASFPEYPTSRPKLAFLRQATRESVLEWRELVRLRVAEP